MEKPVPTELSRTEQGHIKISWPDGTAQELTPFTLRIHCQCANCVHEMTGQQLLDPETVPKDINLDAATPVGHYALNLVFSDGHNTGIYSYERLKGIQPSS